jgi:hypothetical protein
MALQERGSPVNRGLMLLIGTVVAVPVLLWMVRHEEPKSEQKPEPKPEAPSKTAQTAGSVTSPIPAAAIESASVTGESPATLDEPEAVSVTNQPGADHSPKEAYCVTGIIVHDDGTSEELSVNSATENSVVLSKTDGPFPDWVTAGARLQLKLDVPGKKKNQLVVQAEISELGQAELTCDLAAMNAGLKKRYMNFLQALKEPNKKG